MKVTFSQSPLATIGLEWELHLVDRQTHALTPAAAELIDLVGGGEDQPVRKEYLPCMIEIVSQPHARVADAIADLAEHLERLDEAGRDLGVALMGGGSHPFSRPADQAPFRTPRYDIVTERNQWWGRQMAICGTHVHLGVDDQNKVLPMTWTFARFYPYLLAVTASSPFWDGEDSGFASQRTMMFQQLPTNGLPYYFAEWDAFEAYIDDLVACDMITHVDELRWDVRPSPKFGTIENRIPDSATTLRELACEAALTQCLGAFFADSLDRGEEPDYLAPWLVRENKWRSARYGLDATIITPQPGRRTLPLREGLPALLDRLEPYAEQLDCAEELDFTHTILERGASYERQRRWAEATKGRDGNLDLAKVASILAEETITNTPAWYGMSETAETLTAVY
ncbi:MAG: glutamate--cysteine ligase [Propionibacteriaceae bacterium]|jgi:carboxylate-amine ligase|nr:glutamate--cysteine ligase [Propionibacteriaceae bacterium]